MNRVSTRGRSIPRDRRAFRALVVVALGVFGSSLSTGCVKSPLLRQPDGPATPPEASTAMPAVKQPAGASGSISQNNTDYGDRPSSPSSGPPVPSTSGPGFAAPLELQSAPTAAGRPAAEIPGASDRPQPAIPPTTAPANLTPEAPSTPLLDAAIERVTAIRGQQEESPEPEPSPAAPDPTPRKSVSLATILPAKSSSAVKKPEPIPDPDNADLGPAIVPILINHDDLLPPYRPPTGPGPAMAAEHPVPPSRPEKVPGAAAIDASKEKQKPEAPLPAAPATGDSRRPVPPAGDPDRLSIDKLRLCRKVHGFGSFEPCGESEVKVGQRILVYCEMTGMRYEAREGSFVSRLSSKIEIRAMTDGKVVWTSELGPAEDVCGSRRHDFYVNYRVDLPGTLAPGSYCLQLTQTDLVAHSTTSAELPFVIVP